MSRLFEHPPSPLQILFLSVLDGGPEHCHKRIKNTGLYSNALGLTPPSAEIETTASHCLSLQGLNPVILGASPCQ